MTSCLFPIRSQPTGNTNGNCGGIIDVQLPSKHALFSFCKIHCLTVEKMIHATWALVLRRYVGSDTVAFLVSTPTATADCSTYFACLMKEPEPFMSYLISTGDYYHSLPADCSQGNPKTAVVNTGVYYHGADEERHQNGGILVTSMQIQRKLALVVNADFRTDLPKLSLMYDAGVEARCAQNVASTLAKALSEIISLNAQSVMSVNEMDLLSERDQEQLRNLNHHYPPAIDSCIHEMIAVQARATPDAEAICSWDGSLTYRELEDLSSRLAMYLQREYPKQTGPEKAVSICFENSFAAVVAELAVIKTGSAFVPLDGGHPTDRLRIIVDIAELSLVLASPQWAARCKGLVASAVCVPVAKSHLRDMLSSVEPCSPEPTPRSSVAPDNAAFILFTSGSTGKPKAVVQPHGAICALFKSHAKGLHVDSSCRVLQFAAYTFDVSTMDIFTTLMQGGCLCIPSEDCRRTNLAGFIRETQVNWADLTATVANLLYPHQVPTLKTLVLAGEAVQEEHLERWFGHVRLINCYGPVESGKCTAYEFQDRHGKPAATMGYALDGARCWIANPQNLDRLASIGEVGEILVEGPTLSRCYLKDPLRTQTAFVEDLRWSTGGPFSYSVYQGPRRFYRTADMAYMGPDGMLVFVGRSDQQVKVHGQRVELMEIEYHLTTYLPSTKSRAVVAYPRFGPLAERLVAVLQLERAGTHGYTSKSQAFGPFRPLDSPQADLFLRSRLPGYMVPSMLLSIDQIPLTGSGKSDRKRIHDMLCSLPEEVRCTSLEGFDLPPLAAGEAVPRAISVFLSDMFNLDAVRHRDIPLDTLGLSSIQAMALLTWLTSQYGANLSIEYLSKDGVSVRSLAEAIPAEALGTLVSRVDLEREVRQLTESLSLEVRQNLRSTENDDPSPFRSPKYVLLTGGTGYLGIEIFRQLLLQPTVRSIHVLIQDGNQEDGLQRLRQALFATGHQWDSVWEERVVIWSGDLGQPQLGLQKEHWELLTSGKIDSIIHNGAVVRYNLCYEKLKSVNVLSTVEILRAMSHSPCAISLVYVSGGQRLSPEEEYSETARMRQAARSTGYSQSKLVSELVVSGTAKEFSTFLGHRLSIVRPGYIIG
ncbi:non-ribosomal peptide synthetase [Seiridium cupressi]